ncbi:MAG TPA: DNA-binding protein [Firmicutes bacterium]|nr:DNA-binding protein [Bacillota bacterium]
MKNQAYRMAMLFDFYGDLLTDRQKEFYDLYYNEDLSLAEIAENYGISRQGVRDVIVRAEAAMTEVEDKTHIIRRFHQMQGQIAAIDQAADRLLQMVNERSYQDESLDEIGRIIKENTAKLKQE